MQPVVYILYSNKLNRFYTGVMTLSADERLEHHLEKKYGKGHYTRKADDWTLFHYIECEDFSQARKIELHIKKMKSAVYGT
ncbi:GIY-YIG nuclease family protein [Negadavirga shengliensis]|uniref:GIY-YIG nuclease family protein n=1 Tax=Negadavirga shengliensis TaxID=1389218 RepID=A0ABV9T4W9_9BACT